MMKFTVRILLFLLLPLPFLYGLDYIVDKGLSQSRSFYYAEWNDLFQSKINADVLISGSSRAFVHVSPKILDSVLHVNSYNIGMNGTQFSMEYYRFNIYLQHNKKPKYVIQTVDLTSFSENYELYAHQQFLPYLGDTAIQSFTSNFKGKFGIGEYYFPLFKYNNELPLIKEGISCFFGKRQKDVKYKGYEGQNKKWDYTFERYISNSPKGANMYIDTNTVKRMENFQQYCLHNDIKLILVFPPVYYEFLPYCKNLDRIMGIYKSLEQRGAVFINYMNDSLTMSKDNFYNSQHLNRKGAEAFSLKLANDLLPIIK